MVKQGVGFIGLGPFAHLTHPHSIHEPQSECKQMLHDVMRFCEQRDGYVNRVYGLSFYDLVQMDYDVYRLFVDRVVSVWEEQKRIEDELARNTPKPPPNRPPRRRYASEE